METNKLFAYWWGFEDSVEEGLIISCYGLNEQGESILLRITGFKPYIYVELDLEKWTQSILKNISGKWKEKYRSIDTIKFVKKKKLFYNHKRNEDGQWVDTLFPFLYVSFDKKNSIYGFEKDMRYNYFVECLQKKVKVKIHENNASPILQYVCQQDLPTANWIEFKGKRVKKDEQYSSCDYEYRCNASNLIRLLNYNVVPNACIMAYDIEANSTNPDKMPNPKLSGDKIFQISCCIGRVGDKEPRQNILITLGKANLDLLDKSLKVIECEHEGEVLLRFTRIIQKYNPQVITGYNIFSFDIPYMIERSKLCNVFYDFTIQGYTDACANEKEIKWSSTAYKNQNFKYLDAHGRLYVDMLPIIQRDYKLDNYKLKTVSDLFVGETKDPLTAKDIFKCYRLGTRDCKNANEKQIAHNAISIVGKYCVQDSILVFKLFNNLQTWVGLVEMATTCNVPIFTLYTQGQQIKVFSQIYKECLSTNYVVEKDGYIAKDDEKLMGAIVLDPIPGIYDKITPFDFTSLYPTTIIAYNLCFSTLVKDEDTTVDDKHCHVIHINEHKNCIAEGSLVSLPHSSHPIEKLYNHQNVLSFNQETSSLEYTMSNKWFNQGKQECIQLKFDNGRSITCTPDHRILTSENQWTEAGKLSVKDSIQCGIMYPMVKYEDMSIFDFYIDDDLSFTTKTRIECERFLAFCRLLGYLNLYGDSYQYICKTRSKIDAQIIIDDIKLVTREIVKSKFNGLEYIINIPLKFHKNVLHNYMTNGIPVFILHKACPTQLVTEFIGGLFGQSPIYPSYLHSQVLNIGIVISDMGEWYQNTLWELYAIKTTLVNGYLSISQSHTAEFYNSISYRYNTHKQLRLEIICNYMRSSIVKKHKTNWFTKNYKFSTFLQNSNLPSTIFETAFNNYELHTYSTFITSTQQVGEYRVYDISVPHNNSFVCNGIVVHNCDHDTTTLKKDLKNIVCQDYKYRFLKQPKGIVPTLLENLLAARTHVRAQQKDIKKQMGECGDSTQKHELSLLYNVLEKRQLAYKVSANSVYGLYGTRKGYLPFLPGAQCTTALGRSNIIKAGKYIQEHYKAKLVYGDSVVGSTPILFKMEDDSVDIKEIRHLGKSWVSYEQFKQGMSGLSNKEQCYLPERVKVWTVNGWKYVKRVIRHKTNKTLYSVTTPQGYIIVTEDHSLLQQDTLQPVTPQTVDDMDLRLYHDWPIDVYEFDVTHATPEYDTFVDFTDKDAYIFGFLSGSKIIERNGDFIVINARIKRLDDIVNSDYYTHFTRRNVISISTRNVDFIQFYKKSVFKSGVPHCVLNSNHNIKIAYLEGFKHACDNIMVCKTQLHAQGIYFLHKSLGITDMTIINTQQGIFIQQVYTPNVYTFIKKLDEYDSEYVYDIETEDGTFHAGVGELVVKNTDSVYVNFPVQSEGSFENLWDFCEQVESEINSLFIKPMHLSFESAIYDRFFILTKKRYICLKADRHGTISDKLMIRGVLLTRRDNAPMVRDIYKQTIMSIFYKEDKDKIINNILDHIQKMFTRQHDLSVYIITKSIGEVVDYKIKPLSEDEKKREKRLKDLKCTEDEYVNKALPANIQLAEKMRRRGKFVSANQRIEYVITDPQNHLGKQFDKIEDYEYAREHSDVIHVDQLYYLKLMSKSLDEVLYVGLKLNNLVTKQYKYRLNKQKVLDQLGDYFGNNYRILS
jgi:DNA polymerase elongation subunit (family B)